MSPSPSPTHDEPATQDVMNLLDMAREALKQRDRELNKANAELDTTRRQLADVTNRRRDRNDSDGPSDHDDEQPPRKRPAARKNVRTARASTRDAKLAALMEDACQAGHKFAIQHALWLWTDGEPVDFFRTPLDKNYKDEDRFKSDEGRVQGQLRDIRKMLEKKPHLLEHFTEEWFAEQFHLGMRRQTSNTSTRVRSAAREKIFGDNANYMSKAETRRQRFANDIGWTPPEGTKPGYYSPTNASILHSTGCDKYNIEDVFTVLVLIVIFVAILRGPVAAGETRASDGEVVHIPRGRFMQAMHEISYTTAGAIANCAVLVRWALSEDADLFEKGATTQINYKKDHDRYLKILLEALKDNSPSIRKLFRLWDKKVFGLASSRLGGNGADAEDMMEQDMAEARAQMEADAARAEEETSDGAEN